MLHARRTRAGRGGRAVLGTASFWLGFVVNELPFLALVYLLVSTLLAIEEGDVDSAGGRAAVGLAVLTAAGLAVVAGRAFRSRVAAERALREGLGAAHPPGRLPLGRILFMPFPVRPRNVERVANIAYGDAGARNLLDVYRRRSPPPAGPTLIHLHGGRVRAREEEPPGASPPPRAREPGLGVHQRELPPRPGGELPRRPDRREEGHRLGARARPRVRRRPRHDRRRGQLRRRAPRGDGRAHRRRRRAPARVRARRHVGRPRRSRSARTSARAVEADGGRRPRSPRSARTRRRSSSRTAIGTPWSPWSTRGTSSSGCGASRRIRSSTSSCPAGSTRSTSSTPCASRRSSTPSPRSSTG